MPARQTKEQFIEKAILSHGDNYDYSKVHYVNSQTKVVIVCKLHGEFLMKPNHHVSGQGCPKCGRISARKNIALDYSKFLSRAKKVHGDKYTYSENDYKNYTTKMRIYCPIHGYFEQKPHTHVGMKAGCPKCGIIKSAISNQKSWKEVLQLFINAHGKKYEYDAKSYVDVSTKMRIKCPTHGWFEQKPYGHYGGYGCFDCAVEEVHEKQRIDFDEFVERSRLVHGERYHYSKSTFKDIFTPIEINCKTHGKFKQNPRDHYRGAGCPKCKSSRGENSVRLILEELDIRFEEQKTFIDLQYKSKLKCDFYLPDYNTVIEYNGKQHYEPISVFGGEKGFIETQKRDLIKSDYLEKKNIDLVIVRYDTENIKGFIVSKLNKL